MTSIRRFLKDEDGPTSVEYAVMLMMIIIVCIGAIQIISNWLFGSFTNSASEIDNYLS